MHTKDQKSKSTHTEALNQKVFHDTHIIPIQLNMEIDLHKINKC